MKSRSIKSLGTIAVIAIAYILLISAMSWADARLYVRKAADGTLTITKYDAALNPKLRTPQQQALLPNSCYPPELFWDTTLGEWGLSGFDDNMNLVWTGSVNTSGVFTPEGQPPEVVCNTPSAVSTVSSDSPVNCTYTYSGFGVCQPEGLKYQTVVLAAPLGCIAVPPPVLTQPCVWTPLACTIFTYSDWGVCQPDSTQTRTVTSSLPSGCTDGNPVLSRSCVYVTPVNGQCGSANGQSMSSQPATGFCSAGTATAVTGTGPWTWTCAGANGGTTANCVAYPLTPVNGQCGSSNGQTMSSQPTTGLCSLGTASSVTGTGPWTWTCSGANGGTTADCSANIGTVTGTYQTLGKDCGTGVATPISTGAYLYRFTVPQGAYNSVWVAYQQADSYVWSEQVVIKKDGDVTKSDYDAIMATVPATGNVRSTGANNLWYALTRSGDKMGSTIAIRSTPDLVVRTASAKTTFSRDVTFTMVLVAGDVGGAVPSGKTHKVRYCYQ